MPGNLLYGTGSLCDAAGNGHGGGSGNVSRQIDVAPAGSRASETSESRSM